MTIRKKMTLWYAITMAVLYISVCIFVLFSYSPAVRKGTTQFLQDEANSLVDDLETKNGILYWDDAPNTNPGVYYSVFIDDKTLAFSNHELNWLNDLPLNAAETTEIQVDGETWIIVDKIAYEDDQPIAQVRVAYSESTSAQISGTRYMFILFSIAFPIVCIVALGIGWVVARASLQPIDKITKTAAEITHSGQLDKRVGFSNTKDEVGRLANTFDDMISALQDAFTREQQFTNDASHELRTPLSVIITHAEESLHNPQATAEDYRESMEIIFRKGRDMQTMLSQMLLLARMFEGTQALEKSTLNLNEVLFDIAEEMQEIADEKNISLTASATDTALQADLILITRLLINLIGNAIRHTETGKAIEIRGFVEKSCAIIEIDDQGDGISQEDIPHLFERFYQADTSRNSKGTGLGLAISQKIANLHGGEITVTSEKGVGSCFRVSLPLS